MGTVFNYTVLGVKMSPHFSSFIHFPLHLFLSQKDEGGKTHFLIQG